MKSVITLGGMERGMLPGPSGRTRRMTNGAARCLARRTGEAAAFLAPHLQAGMRLIDCGCGAGSITLDLAVAPGETIGIDLREDFLRHGHDLARERVIANVQFQTASVYHLPYADGVFDAAFCCSVLQHLAAPLLALKEMRRVLKPGEG